MLGIIKILECFAPVFFARIWRHAKILLIGAILCRKERTVVAIPRVMGLENDPHFTNSKTDGLADWTHTNTVQELPPNHWYDEGDGRFKPGNVLISVRNQNTIYICHQRLKGQLVHGTQLPPPPECHLCAVADHVYGP